MRLLVAALLLTCACDTTGDVCNTKTTDIGDVCLPSTIAPGLPSVIQVRELCGVGCSSMPSCTALLGNATVTLDVTGDVCQSNFSASCLDQGCLQRVMSCTLPALAAGRYVLVLPGGPPRSLVVASGGPSSCRFQLTDGGVQ